MQPFSRTKTVQGEVKMLVRTARACLLDALGPGVSRAPADTHLHETMAWLCRAQDAVNGGVSYGYSLVWNRVHRRSGWLTAYPETTGYIIPSFLDYFAATGQEVFRERALQMARWEIDVQMSEGAVLAGFLGSPRGPAVFNTGQVLFGWVAAYEESRDERFLAAARRAADYLVREQDADGAWRSDAAAARRGVHAYDARTSWGLAETARVSGEWVYADAARRNLDFVLTRQNEAGWFTDNCLTSDEHPLLHTIAYVAEGLLGAGMLLSEPCYVDACRLTAEALAEVQRGDGALAGRYDSRWRPAAGWTCLTGIAQTALVWLRLYLSTKEQRYLDSARAANRYVCGTQDLATQDPGVRGGVKGSQPVWAEYARLMYPNWAAKFLADSLLLQRRIDAT
jgi:uncharacterized protein YyaL (SSP411 family)